MPVRQKRTKKAAKTSLVRGRLPDCMLNMPAFMIYKIAQYLKEQADALFAADKIDARGFGVLYLLCSIGPLTQQNLCESLWIDRGSMVGVLNRLEKKRFVKRQKNLKDARSHIVVVTDAGRRFHGKWSATFQSLELNLFPTLDETDWQQFRKLLRRLIQTWQP